jgi:MFS family permease
MSSSDTPTATFRYRFLVLFIFCLSQIANAMPWIAFAPINSLAQQYYGVDANAINMLSVVYMILYIPGSILSLYIYTRFNLKFGIALGMLLTSIGCWIRVHPSYGATMVGQIIAGIAQPLITNAPAKLAGSWFPVSERALATAVGSIFNPVGIGLGQLFPTIFVSGTSTTGISGMQDFMIFDAGFATGVLLITLLLFKDKPDVPPSRSAQERVEFELAAESGDFKAVLSTGWVGVKNCFKEKPFIILWLSFSCGLGIFNALTTLIEQLTKPVCYTPDDASIFGVLLLGCGVLGAIAAGAVLDAKPNYNLALRIGFIMSFLMAICWTLALQVNQYEALAAMSGLTGFFVVAMLPVSFEAAVETTYPVPEDVSGGLLMAGGQYPGIAFIFILSALIDTQPKCNPSDTSFRYPASSGVIIASMAVCAVTILFFKGERKRLAMDRGALV